VVSRDTTELTLQPPATKTQEGRRGEEGVQLVVEIGSEDVHVEVEPLPWHRVELELVLIEEALEAVRHRCRLHFIERRALGDDLAVALLELLLLCDDLEEEALERIGELLSSFFGPALVGNHRLPIGQIGVVLRLVVEEVDPTLERLEVESGLAGRPLRGDLLLTGHTPRRQHVPRGLQRQHAGSLVALRRQVLPETLFQALDELLVLLELLRLVLVRYGVLVVVGVVEDAGERVVIVRADRVVLVVVTAGAPDREAQEGP
jgi:hypothetical protein